MTSTPSYLYENIMFANGFERIAGVDEAGRGSIAGPIVAAACILPPNCDIEWIHLLNDSKQLSRKERDSLFTIITENCEYGIAMIDAKTIDKEGMAKCGIDVLENAIMAINPTPECALVDYFKLPCLPIPQMSITKGDALSFSIAAASIIAKVTRDRLMEEYDKEYPVYQFAKHKGYGTALHMKLIRENGFSPIHRKTFCTHI